ncbi:chalcone synthase B [Hyaloscypha finlandica]|nr:chalcone synthase B [Hyaloscypha finlandica]
MNDKTKPDTSSLPVPDLWITGIGTQYPPYLHTAEKFARLAERFHDTEKPVLKKLLRLTHNCGIDTRASTLNMETGFGCQEEIPTITDLDHWFRKHGVDLTAQVCRKALREWAGDAAEDITHTVAFNSGVQSFSGYDYLVARKLGLSYDAENIFLQGVGCAGGLSVMRVAAEVACGATLLKKPARILCFSCELNTPYVRHQYTEAQTATDLENMDIAVPAARLGTCCYPRYLQNMGAVLRTTGYSSIITRQVPNLTKKAVPPLFEKCFGRYREKTGQHDLGLYDLDWALHPGGMAIIDGVKEELKLTEEQIRATRQIYRTRGNSGSPTVLCVLDMLRTMGEGKDHVVAVAFGPGLGTEMSFLRRCRGSVAVA